MAACARLVLCLFAAILAAGTPPCEAGVLPRPLVARLSRIAGLFGPRTLAAPPEWAKTDAKPLWSFAWASDMHLDRSNAGRTALAMQLIDREWKPHFVLITGDNGAIAAPADNGALPEPESLRRQRYLKSWLDKNLRTPRAIIPGDNWPQDFDRVFGPSQYAFDCGGLRFVMLAPDRHHKGQGPEGLSVLDEPTWTWLARDLQAHRDRPVVVAIHEPVYPPTFLDAPRLRRLLDGYPNVVAVLQGHLHADMELTAGGRKYLVAPALGPGDPPGLKHVRVYRERLVVRTAAYDQRSGRFALVQKWQRIDLPKPLRKGLAAPPGPFKMADYTCVPAHPLRDDPELANRLGELAGIFQAFLGNELPRMLLQAARR